MSDPSQTVDVAVVGAGLAGLTAARDLVGGGQVGDGARGARPRRRADAERGPRRRQGGRGRRPVDRPHARTGWPRWRAQMGVDTYPTYAEGQNLNEWRGKVTRYSGTIPRINPAALVDVGQAMARLNRMARSGAAGPPVGRAQGRAVGRHQRAHLDGPLDGHPRRQGGRWRWGSSRSGRSSPRTSRCCTCCSTRTPPAAWRCCSTPRAGPRSAASSAARSWCPSAWPSAWATTWSAWRRPCAGSSMATRA